MIGLTGVGLNKPLAVRRSDGYRRKRAGKQRTDGVGVSAGTDANADSRPGFLGKDDSIRGKSKGTTLPNRCRLGCGRRALCRIGGNAVAAWVSRVDETAVRNTQDVDILLRRSDLSVAIAAMAQAGFVHRHAAGLDMFLDGDNAGARDAVHVVFAAEKVRPDYFAPAPDTTESEATDSFRLLTLSALARMKLTSFRDKDRTHLRDLIEVGLLDASWVARFPSELGVRLQHLLDNSEG